MKSVPLDLLAGKVRNQEEALLLAKVDVLWQQEEHILEHLLAAHSYLRSVSQCEQAVVDVGLEPRLNPALVLVGNARQTLTQGIAGLEARFEGVQAELKAIQAELQRYAEVNRSVHAELVEAGCVELAGAKQQLFQLETELCSAISRRRTGRAEADALGACMALGHRAVIPAPHERPSCVPVRAQAPRRGR